MITAETLTQFEFSLLRHQLPICPIRAFRCQASLLCGAIKPLWALGAIAHTILQHGRKRVKLAIAQLPMPPSNGQTRFSVGALRHDCAIPGDTPLSGAIHALAALVPLTKAIFEYSMVRPLESHALAETPDL